MKRVGHVSRMGCNRNVCRVLVRNHERRNLLTNKRVNVHVIQCNLNKYIWDVSGCGYEQVSGCCNYGNERAVST